MSGPNHVAGGLVYTGVFCSFFNVNIFSNPWYIVGTLFFALLPDIDHTKSPVGKAFAFTRLPNYLDVKFGHRTITHSIFIYLVLGVIIYLVESVVSLKHTFTLIYFLAYSSHLVFDMMTVSGVPLLYPWKKNPFVIPGNPDYRLRVKDIKSESIVFALFLGVFLFCIPLFENGFWTTYNRQFGTLDHLFREYSNSKDLLEVEYDFLVHGEQHIGKGILLHAEKSKAYILADSSVVEINDKAKINALLPAHTQQPRKEQEHFFLNIRFDSLRSIMRNKVILEAEFQSSEALEYATREHYKTGKVVKLEYDYNPFMHLNSDTVKAEILRKIEIKKIELDNIITKEQEDHKQYQKIVEEIIQINRNYETMTMADQEKAVPRLRELEHKKQNYQFKELDKDKILKQLEHLYEQLAEGNTSTFSGKLVCLNF